VESALCSPCCPNMGSAKAVICYGKDLQMYQISREIVRDHYNIAYKISRVNITFNDLPIE
jgi:hypothetical protein